MRKIVSLCLVVVAAVGSVSIHEAAAQSRGDKGRSESVGRSSGEFRDNYRYRRFCMPTVDGTGRLYNDDMSGWRRVSSCNGYQLVD